MVAEELDPGVEIAILLIEKVVQTRGEIVHQVECAICEPFWVFVSVFVKIEGNFSISSNAEVVDEGWIPKIYLKMCKISSINQGKSSMITT